MSDLKAKDNLQNSELEVAIKKFYNNVLIYYLTREPLKKILNTYNINYKGYFVIKLKDKMLYYYDWDNYITINDIIFPIVTIEC